MTYSLDGYDWKELGKSFFLPEDGMRKSIRDSSITRGPDGTFHMVWMTGLKDDKGFGYASSENLIDWSKHKFMEIMAHEPMTADVESPELFYDESEGHFVIIWASTILPNFYQAFQEDTNNNLRLWYTTTSDFDTFARAMQLPDPGYSVKDGVIFRDNKRKAW